MDVRRVLWLVCGWGLVVIGLVLLPAPVPIPLIGAMPILIGLAILTTHSKTLRRRLQYFRHRFGWLSRCFDNIAHRTPEFVRTMIHRTRPAAFIRHARIRGRRDRTD